MHRCAIDRGPVEGRGTSRRQPSPPHGPSPSMGVRSPHRRMRPLGPKRPPSHPQRPSLKQKERRVTGHRGLSHARCHLSNRASESQLKAPAGSSRTPWGAWWRVAGAGAGLGQSNDCSPVALVGGLRDGHGLSTQRKTLNPLSSYPLPLEVALPQPKTSSAQLSSILSPRRQWRTHSLKRFPQNRRAGTDDLTRRCAVLRAAQKGRALKTRSRWPWAQWGRAREAHTCSSI